MNILQGITPFVIVAGFLLFMLGYGLYSVYAVHHLNEFGYSGDTSQLMIRAYIGFTTVVILLTIVAVIVGAMTL